MNLVIPVDLREEDYSLPTVEEPIPSSLLQQWKTQGFALLNNYFPEELIDQAKQEIQALIAANSKKVTEDFGGFSYPFQHSTALNSIVLHPCLLSFVQHALGTKEIRLIQGEAWMKKSVNGGKDPLSNQDQRMHMDYPNHTLTHTSSFEKPEVIAMILYFDDSSVCGGETAVVPRDGGPDDPFYQMPYNKMPGTGKHHWMNDKTATEAYFQEKDPEIYAFRQSLYAKERYAAFSKGTLLLYRHDLYHRGTPLKEGQTRIVLNLAYKRAECSWITSWHHGWAKDAYDTLWGVIPSLNEEQKAALGIPRAEDPYWKEGKNRENNEARYHEQEADQYYC